MSTESHKLATELLRPNGRNVKPRETGITIVLDKGIGPSAARDLGEVSGAHCDYAKIAWASSLITGNLETKLAAYRDHDICPILGGTLFEYCYRNGTTEKLHAICREFGLHVEISDGVVEIPRPEKLKWIEKFAAVGQVFSEVGGKTSPQDLPWEKLIEEEFSAGSFKVVIEGRQIGPTNKEVRLDLLERILGAFDSDKLVFEALERYQQVLLIKRLGPNVNLGNILPQDVLTLESFRRGLKEQTLQHFE